MTWFQWLSVSGLGIALVRELVALGRREGSWTRCVIFVAAMVAIIFPDGVQTIAESIGIRRGADLVLYIFALAFIAASFYFYSRNVRLQRQVTLLVRHLTIRDAQRGGK